MKKKRSVAPPSAGKLPPVLQNHTGYLITDIGRLYRIVIDRRMARFDMTRSQWWLLAFLYFFEGSTQQDLADLMDLGKGGVAKLIERLEQKGMVVRKADAKDARSRRVYLSERARPMVEELEGEIESSFTKSMRSLKAAEVAGLNRSLKLLRQALLDELSDG